MNAPQIPGSGSGLTGLRMGLVAGAVVSLAALSAGVASAAMPTAGTKIGNQATATYDNGSGELQTTPSNVVLTEVLPVYDLLLEPGSTKQVSPGGEVKWSHTLTNLGNAPDVANMTLVDNTGTFDLNSIAVYIDQNQDGIPDTGVNLIGSNIPLDIGEAVNLLVVATAPNTATNGQTDNLDLTATSVNDAAVTDTDNDVAIVVEGGVVTINKSIIDTPAGKPGTTDVTMKIVLTNTGNDDATAITMLDPIPAGMTYTPGTASINVVFGGAVTDAADGLEPGGANNSTVPLDYSFAGTDLAMTIPTLKVGEVIELTFDVSIDAGIAAQTINNIANVSYTGGGETRTDTDNATYDVLAAPAVTLTGDTQGPVTEGATVDLTNVITNTGTTSDDFDVIIDLRMGQPDGYPIGTTYTILVDGAPLVSNDNGNAYPDLEVAAGGSRNIVVRVNLPPDIDVSTYSGPYVGTKTVRSLTDSTVSAVADDIVSVIKAATTDLTNTATNLNDGGVDGTGAGPEATPVSTVSGLPGETVTLELVVTNTNDPAEGNVSDNYALSYDAITANPGGAGSQWLVRFEDAAGNVITVTPDIAAGASYTVYAKVTIPANELASVEGTTGTPVTFRIESANSGALDAKLDSVYVDTTREILLEADQAKQTFPGGVVIYSHTLTNAGNVTEGDVALSLTDINSTDFTPSTIYLDVNGDGLINAGDIINPTPADIQLHARNAAGVKDGSFDPGDTVALLVRVQAQANAPSGAENVTTITATASGVINSVAAPAPASNDDTTTVISGDIKLQKYQALDDNCDGTPEGAYVDTLLQAKPGTCLIYRIVATNVGTRVASNLVITDAIPEMTTYNGGQGPTCANAPAGDGQAQVSAGAITSAPTCGNTGTVEATVGTLLPTDAPVTMTFSIKINE